MLSQIQLFRKSGMCALRCNNNGNNVDDSLQELTGYSGSIFSDLKTLCTSEKKNPNFFSSCKLKVPFPVFRIFFRVVH